MAAICSCSTGILNHGQPNCVDSFARDARLIFVKYKDDAGAVNSIDSADVLDQTFFDGKFNNTDLSQRWYATPTINGVAGERAESTKQDIDGIPYNVRQGIRMYDGTFFGNVAATPYITVLKSMSCQTMGFFIVDVSGNLIGMNNELTGDLDPILIQRNTLDVTYKFPSSSELQNVNIKFAYEENEQDGDLDYIAAGDISVDMLTQLSMSTVVMGTATGISTTTFTTPMTFTYGPHGNRIKYEGAVIGDFVLTEVTPTPSTIVITSVTESSAGVYDFVIPTQTGSDVLNLAYQKTSGTGFEATTDLSITIT